MDKEELIMIHNDYDSNVLVKCHTYEECESLCMFFAENELYDDDGDSYDDDELLDWLRTRNVEMYPICFVMRNGCIYTSVGIDDFDNYEVYNYSDIFNPYVVNLI